MEEAMRWMSLVLCLTACSNTSETEQVTVPDPSAGQSSMDEVSTTVESTSPGEVPADAQTADDSAGLARKNHQNREDREGPRNRGASTNRREYRVSFQDSKKPARFGERVRFAESGDVSGLDATNAAVASSGDDEVSTQEPLQAMVTTEEVAPPVQASYSYCTGIPHRTGFEDFGKCAIVAKRCANGSIPKSQLNVIVGRGRSPAEALQNCIRASRDCVRSCGLGSKFQMLPSGGIDGGKRQVYVSESQ